jgi:hypothetical protein
LILYFQTVLDQNFKGKEIESSPDKLRLTQNLVVQTTCNPKRLVANEDRIPSILNLKSFG